ncbi:MAG: glycosyltransferase [Candidatus Moranbacteria bacterium]|nr:glycosyltransferase [Candidatus Moranbacteria bacterium]
MQLSIIIPVYYGEKIFEKCLSSLYPDCNGRLEKDWEILALNNGFDPKRWEEIRARFPRVKFFGDGGKNLGFAAGNNFLLKKAKGKYILMLNQDVFIKPGVIKKLADFLENNSDYSCVSPQLRYGNGSIQSTCRTFPKGFWFLLTDFVTRGKVYRNYYSPRKSQEVDQPMASCLLWRGNILKKLGGFDAHPHFFLYFNDVDISYRLSQMGGKTYFLSSVHAVHLHGQSAYSLKEIKRLYFWWKGLGRFWYKKGDNFFIAYFKAFWITFFSGLSKLIKRIASG